VSFATVFLDDRDTYSDISGAQIVIFDSSLEHADLCIEDAKAEISIDKLITELIKVKELLPIHIQEIIKPFEDVSN